MHGGLPSTLLLLLAGTVSAQQAVDRPWIVLSSERKPYLAAAKRIAADLAATTLEVKTLTLRALQRDLQTLRGAKPKLVYTIGSPAASWFAKHRPAATIQLYCMVTDPEKSGLLGSRFIHGIAALPSLATQFDHIRAALPDRAKTIGLLYDSTSARGRRTFARAKRQIPAGWQLRGVDTSRFVSLGKAIDRLLATPPGIVWTVPDPGLYSAASLRALLLKCVRRQVPVYGYSRSLVRAGAVVGFFVDPEDQGRQCAALTKRALEITAATDRRVALHLQPEHGIQLNLLAARQLGIRIPKQLIARATVLVTVD